MSLTQWVGGRALEDEPVCGKEYCALSGEQRRASHQPRGLFSAVGDQVDPHGVHYQLLTGQQQWPQQLGLHRQEEKRGGISDDFVHRGRSEEDSTFDTCTIETKPSLNFTTSFLKANPLWYNIAGSVI